MSGDLAGMAYAVAFSPDGRHLVAGGEDGIATIWDVADGQEVHRLPEKHENTAVSVAFSPDGRLLATGSWGGVAEDLGHTDRPAPPHDPRAYSPDRVPSCFAPTAGGWRRPVSTGR